MSSTQAAGHPSELRATGALVVGEALIDVVARDGASSAHPGGSPMNVAVGLARLGVPALLHTAIGADAHGDLIRAHLAGSGVPLTGGSTTAAKTSVAEAAIDGGGAAHYLFDIEWAPQPLPANAGHTIVHTGSIAAVLEPGRDAVRGIVNAHRASATISFDPNVRPRLMGDHDEALAVVLGFVALADVVKASDEDIDWLYPGRDPGEVAAEWRELGPAIVVVTRGADGALAVARSGRVDVPAPRTELVDTVGAGDSFMAAMLAALDARSLTGAGRRAALQEVDAATIADVVAFAARCAAITVGRAGANPPWLGELGGDGARGV